MSWKRFRRLWVFRHHRRQAQPRAVQLEPLEDRLLLSNSPQLLKDINLGVAGSGAASFTSLNGTVFFTANDGVLGSELWKTDGTAAGTVLVKDINPGGAGSYPYPLKAVGGTLFFAADDGVNGLELWKTDGTEAGTVLVKDINPGGASSFPFDLTAVGGTLFFRAFDDAHGTELWKSDGTEAGTVLVKDILPGSSPYGPYSSYPGQLTAVGGTLFFTANDGTHGTELWKSDGTEAGTVLVKDIFPGSGPYGFPYSSYPSSLTAVGGTLFFTANDGTHGTELWKSDGTEGGTVLVKDINPGHGSYPFWLTAVGGTLFFTANDGTTGNELWKSDGTAKGTVLVKDIRPGSYPSGFPYGSYPFSLTAVGGRLFFTANDGVNGYELWKSNGTAKGTVLVQDINPGGAGSYPAGLTDLNGTLYFAANDGTHGVELWQSNGQAKGTALVQDINPGSAGSYPLNLTAAGGTLYFTADDGQHGAEPWILVTEDQGGAAADRRSSASRGGALQLAASGTGGNAAPGFPTSDTLLAQALLTLDAVAGRAGWSTRVPTSTNGTQFFTASSGSSGSEPWVGPVHPPPLVPEGRSRGEPEGGDAAALSAFDGFRWGAEEGRFPHLSDRDGVWRLTWSSTSAATSAAGPSHRRG